VYLQRRKYPSVHGDRFIIPTWTKVTNKIIRTTQENSIGNTKHIKDRHHYHITPRTVARPVLNNHMESKRLLEIKSESSSKHPIHTEPSLKPLSKRTRHSILTNLNMNTITEQCLKTCTFLSTQLAFNLK
jgi:hypothetical protein